MLERRSVPKILAASTSFFLRSRAGGWLVLCSDSFHSQAGRAWLRTVVDHLLEVGGDLAAALAAGDHGGQRDRSRDCGWKEVEGIEKSRNCKE